MKKIILIEQLNRINRLMGINKTINEGWIFRTMSELIEDMLNKAVKEGENYIVSGKKISAKTFENLFYAAKNPVLFDALNTSEKILMGKLVRDIPNVVDDTYNQIIKQVIDSGFANSEEEIVKNISNKVKESGGNSSVYDIVLELTKDASGKVDEFEAALISGKFSKKVGDFNSGKFTPEISAKVADDVVNAVPTSNVLNSELFSFTNRLASNLPDKIEGFIVGKQKRETDVLLRSIKNGTKKSLTESEFNLIIANVNRKQLAKALMDEFRETLNIDKFTDDAIFLIKRVKEPYEEYLINRESVKDIIKINIPLVNGSNKWADNFLDEFSYLWGNEFKTKLGNNDKSLLQKLIKEESDFISTSEGITKEYILDIAYWDGNLFDIPDAQRDLILKNSDSTFIGKVKNLFVNRTADFDRVIKLLKTYTTTTEVLTKNQIEIKLVKELESLTSNNLTDIQLVMNYLEQLKVSEFISKEEKDSIDNLLDKLKSSSDIIKKWGTVNSIYEEKSVVTKFLLMIRYGLGDSMDTINQLSFGKLDPGIRLIKGKGKLGFSFDFSMNMAKKLENEGYDVNTGTQLFANAFFTGSQRGLPKLTHTGAQEIFEDFGNINWLRGVYILTLGSKIAKGAAVSAAMITFMEMLVYFAKDSQVQACYRAVKKLAGSNNEVTLNEDNLPDECSDPGKLFMVAWDFSTQNGKINIDPKAGPEFDEKYGKELSKPLGVWLIHAQGLSEVIYHCVQLYQYINNLTSFKSQDEIRNALNGYLSDLKKSSEEAAKKIEEEGQEIKKNGGELQTRTQEIADSVRQKIEEEAKWLYYNKAEIDSINQAKNNAQDNNQNTVTTTLTPESFKQQYSCYWEKNLIDVTRGTQGIEIINDKTIRVYLSGVGMKRDCKTKPCTMILMKVGSDWLISGNENKKFACS